MERIEYTTVDKSAWANVLPLRRNYRISDRKLEELVRRAVASD